ncbi:MAG TPA: pseudouridine synthase, partial [Bradyrhizobium sp.]|nr:pseudouridine synthase [Bradyrhizobium sp.]
MPRDNDKNNNGRGRRDRPSAGKGRSGVARGPEKKFAKRGFAGKSEGGKRPYAGRSEAAESSTDKPYSRSSKPYADKREGFRPRREYGDAPRAIDERRTSDRPQRFNRDERPAARFHERKFGDRKPYASRDG